jgi:hypothetical protein
MDRGWLTIGSAFCSLAQTAEQLMLFRIGPTYRIVSQFDSPQAQAKIVVSSVSAPFRLDLGKYALLWSYYPHLARGGP